MAAEQKNPWMVWYAPMLPHDPHNPPKKYLDRTKPLTSSETIAKYWANVEWFDQTVGDLLGMLESKGLAKDTLVVYVTDNGWIQDPVQSKYAAKSKQSPYEGGVRTPILLRWPGKISAQDSSDFAHSIDLMPTVLKAIGIQNANNLDVPQENLRWRWAIRDNWKLIVPNPSIEKDGVVELYDLATDPREEKNLATIHPGVAQELAVAIDQWWPECSPSH
jgi:uncharacterized sulfatase